MATRSERVLDGMHHQQAIRRRLLRKGQMPLSAVRQGDELILAIDLPGVRKGDVDVQVDRDTLEVKAHRRLPPRDLGRWLVDERSYGDWHRRLRLASDGAKVVNVRMESGVLTITIHFNRASAQSSPAQSNDVLVDESTLAPEELYDSFIESAVAQVEFFEELKRESEAMRRDTVSLKTPTGVLKYTLPLSREETYSSTDVGEILSPTGQPHRSIAQHRRQANELLGVKIANKYRYPKFQLDAEHHQIIPVVKYANSQLESDADPWGTLDWWYSEDEALDARRPVDLVEGGELTTQLVDFAIESGQQGME